MKRLILAVVTAALLSAITPVAQEELKTAVAERVVTVEASNRSWRLRVLQDRIDRMLALSAARGVMYGNQLGEARRRIVNNAAEQKLAIAEG